MKIVGHRGARGLAPENTLAALHKGLEHKVDELEFDLRVTKDGVVILHHDPEVSMPSGQKLAIHKCKYEELLDYKADLATFEQILSDIGNQVILYVEVKPGEPLEPIVKIFQAYLAKGWQPTDFKIASRSQKNLLALHKALPDIPKIVIEPWSGVRAHRRARQVNTNMISMNQRWLWWGFIWSVKRGGTQLYTYTLNDAAKARRWEKYGLYAVITDYPDRF